MFILHRRLDEGFVSDQEGKKQSKNLLKYARDFIFGGLNGFDKVDLKSMGMANFFILTSSGTGQVV